MTKDKDEKNVIRARMAKTGESYATARAQLAREGDKAEGRNPVGGVLLSHRAGQALQAWGRLEGSPWVLVLALRATKGTAGQVLEELGFPALSYDEFLRAAEPAAGSRDEARPFSAQDPLAEVLARASALAAAESRPRLDSGCLLRVCAEVLTETDVPAADHRLLERLKGAHLKAMCSSVERREGLEGEPPREGRGLFERFTDRARVVVVRAQEEARELGHTWIGTEHLLLGLLHEGQGVAANALRATGVESADLRARVVAAVGPVDEQPEGHIPFTPRAKTVLELAGEKADALGHEHIGTEHLLLALVAEVEGVAAQVLAEMGLSADVVRGEVMIMIGRAYPEPDQPGA